MVVAAAAASAAAASHKWAGAAANCDTAQGKRHLKPAPPRALPQVLVADFMLRCGDAAAPWVLRPHFGEPWNHETFESRTRAVEVAREQASF